MNTTLPVDDRTLEAEVEEVSVKHAIDEEDILSFEWSLSLYVFFVS